MYLYRVLAGTFSQVRFGQYVGIFNDQFRQFLLYQQLSDFKHCIIFYFRKSAFLQESNCLYTTLYPHLNLFNIIFQRYSKELVSILTETV